MDKWRILFVLIIAVLVSLGIAEATTRTVCKSGCTYSTIQAGMNAAVSGDTVSVTDGNTYSEIIEWKSNGTTLDCQNAKLQGSGSGTGITMSGKYNNLIKNCQITGYSLGIYLDRSNTVVVQTSTIFSNSVGGVVLFNSPDNSISRNIIRNNGYGIRIYQCSTSSTSCATIEFNSIYSNSGYGVDIDTSPKIYVNNNSIYNNQANGINIASSSNNNIFSNNIYSNTNYGIRISTSSGNYLNSNNFCPSNSVADIQCDGGCSGNSGDLNKCDKPGSWNDAGTTGCKYPCTSCTCTQWNNQGCGLNGCLSTQEYQTRSCDPAGCANTSRCWDDTSCLIDNASVTSFFPPTGSLARGQSTTTNTTVRNTGTSTRSFWAAVSFQIPNGSYYDIPPQQTSVLSPGSSQTVSFNWVVPANAPFGGYNALTAAWNGYDAVNNLMVPPKYDQKTVLNAFSVVNACSDGTPYGQCSATKPLYCSNGNLINKCSVCGCSSGQTCLADESCITPCDNSSYLSCPSAYTLADGELKDMMCGSSQFYKIATTQTCVLSWILTLFPQTDYDMYVKWSNSCPSTTNYDNVLTQGSGYIQNYVAPGTYHAMVKKISASGPYGAYSIRAFTTNCISNIGITPSVSYDNVVHILSVSAYAYDKDTGNEVTVGTGAYELYDASGHLLTNGTLTYSSGRWRATKTIDLPVDYYSVSVIINGARESTTFFVSATSAMIQGYIKDKNGNSLSNVLVQLFNSLDYQQGRLPIASKTSMADGYYNFTASSGSYVLKANKTGYVDEVALAFSVSGGQTIDKDLTMTPTGSYALTTKMAQLKSRLEGFAGNETEMISNLSVMVSEDFSDKPEWWLITIDMVNAFSDAIEDKAITALGNVYVGAADSIVDKKLYEYMMDKYVRFGWRNKLLSIAPYITEQEKIDTYNFIVAYNNASKNFTSRTPAEYKNTTVYLKSIQHLSDLHSSFTSPPSPHPDFDESKARSVIGSQIEQLNMIDKGWITLFNLPQSSEPVTVGVKNNYNAYLNNKKNVNFFNTGQTVISVISFADNIVDWAVTFTGVGKFVNSMVMLGLGIVQTTFSKAEIHYQAESAQEYSAASTQWMHDVMFMAEIYNSTAGFIKQEAANPYYLNKNKNFASHLSINLNADKVINGENVVFVPWYNALSFRGSNVERNATINITNDQDDAYTRVASHAAWEYDLSWVGKMIFKMDKITFSQGDAFFSTNLTRGQSVAKNMTYHGTYGVASNILNPHVLTVVGFSGPFYTSVDFDYYYVIPPEQQWKFWSTGSSISPQQLSDVENLTINARTAEKQLTINDVVDYVAKTTKVNKKNVDINKQTKPTGAQLTQTQPSGYSAIWHLDEGSGITAYDSSGNGYNGTLTGTTWNSQADSKEGASSLSFVNLGDMVELPVDALNNMTSGTVEMWIYPTALSEFSYFMSKEIDGMVNYFGLLLDSQGRIIYRIYYGADLYSNSIVPINKWTHVAVTWNYTERRIYINDALDKISYVPSMIPNVTHPYTKLYLGRQVTSATNRFIGRMDEVKISNIVREFQSQPTKLMLNPDYPVHSFNFSVNASYYALETQLFYPSGYDIDLHVYDPEGKHVGYDQQTGESEIGFTATYSGKYSMPEIIYIPAATNKTYSIEARLVKTNSNVSVPIGIGVLQTPFRPAILAATPNEVIEFANINETINTFVEVGEAGKQKPLLNVNVTLSDIINGNNSIQILSNRSSFHSIISAGDMQGIKYQLQTPLEYGNYTGKVTITSESAGTLEMNVTVFVTKPKPKNLTVCKSGACDYTTIQAALNATNYGDTVLVTDQGVYNESINLAKDGVTLDCNGAIFDGNGLSSPWWAILMENRHNNTVKNCVVKNYPVGIMVQYYSSNNRIINNTVLNISGDGFGLYASAINNTIENNTANSNNIGIMIIESYNNTIRNNNLTNNSQYSLYVGLMMDYIGNVEQCDNTIVGNIGGHDGKNILYAHNTEGLIIQNTDDYSEIIFCAVNNSIINNVTIDNGDGLDARDGVLFTIMSNNNTLVNSSLNNTFLGIGLYSYSNNNTIFSNKFYFNSYAVMLIASSNNIVRNNTFDRNGYSIYMNTYPIESGNNIIENNTMTNNFMAAFALTSNHDIIRFNNISDNRPKFEILAMSGSEISSNMLCPPSLPPRYDFDSWSGGVIVTAIAYNNTCSRPGAWNDTDTVGCTYACPTAAGSGDINGDCSVNVVDLATVGRCFGVVPYGNCAKADLNRNGAINIFDLATVGVNFGRKCEEKTFEVTYSFPGGRIYGYPPVPQMDGFDYYITQEKIKPELTGRNAQITYVEVKSNGTNLGDVINFDWEVHLDGSGTGLPAGQYNKTLIDPVTGYTRNAKTQFRFAIGNEYDTNNYTFSGAHDFITNLSTASPYLGGVKVANSSVMNLVDGLHAQLFLWTADNRNCKIEFGNITLLVKGNVV